jgi:hypothetical protein
MAAMPEDTAITAKDPLNSLILFSNSSTVGFVMREYACLGFLPANTW